MTTTGLSLESVHEEAALYEESRQYGAVFLQRPQESMFRISKLFTRLVPITTIGSNFSGILSGFFSYVCTGYGHDSRRWIDSSPRLSEQASALVADLIGEESEQTRCNYLPLIVMQSVLCEIELQRILVEPARIISEDIMAAQREENRSFNLEAMDAWAERQVPATLGITCMVVCGLRWGLKQRRAAVGDFVASKFKEDYIPIITSGNLSLALDEIRTKFRNASCHGRKTQYANAEYKRLGQLVFGANSVTAWSRIQNQLKIDPGLAVLHNHLSLRRSERVELDAFVSRDGYIKCPCCDRYFSIRGTKNWDGTRHLACGAPLNLVKDDDHLH